MLIFGKKEVYINSQKLKTAICPICSTEGSIILSIIREHGHLYWIPIFPFKKKAIFDCWHCKNAFGIKDMPQRYEMQAENMKLSARGPIWQYSGLVIIAVFLVWAFYIDGEKKRNEAEFLATPLQGDVYEYKNESGNYSTFKIMDISNDSIFVTSNNLEIRKSYKLYKIDKTENYSQSTYGISKNKIKEMYDSGEIIDVNRIKDN